VTPLLLTFDVEEFDWPVDGRHKLPLSEQIGVTAEGLGQVLSLLERRRARATFFVTGTVAREAPVLVTEIVEAGHEVAAHGLEHGDDYATLDPEVAIDRLQIARNLLVSVSGHEVLGVRFPRLRQCPCEVVQAAGLRYDASPHPTWLPGRYFGLHLPRKPWQENGVTKIPISVIPWLRLPVSWQWFQLLGPGIGRAGIRAALHDAPYLHLYFHPWEAVDLRDLGISSPFARRTGAAFLNSLDVVLSWADGRLPAIPIREFLRL
jgi:peptidoglycan/xylan/chitin deacetylase (PgdA/CDA1 family)